jgi:hypothetical protein
MIIYANNEKEVEEAREIVYIACQKTNKNSRYIWTKVENFALETIKRRWCKPVMPGTRSNR